MNNFQSIFSGQNDPGYDPLMGLALGLLQAGGPSRMPTSLGQALGRGFTTAQQFNQAGIQNQMQRMMLPYQQAKINWMTGQDQSGNGVSTPAQAQPQPQSQAPETFSTAGIQGFQGPATTQGASVQPTNVPLPQAQAAADPTASLSAPATTQDPYQDPIYLHWVQGAAMGIPGASDLAAQRLQILTTDNPAFQGQLARAKAMNTPQNIRQGGTLYDPLTGKPLYYSPKLEPGQQMNANGQVEVAPGYLPTSLQLQAAQQYLKNANTMGPPGTTPSGVQYPRSTGQALGQPTTIPSIIRAVTLQSPAAPQAPIGIRAPARPQAPTEGIGGVPVPPQSTRPNVANAPTSLGAPTTAALKSTYKDATESMTEAVEAGADAQNQLGSLAEMRTALANMDTGPGSEFRIGADKLAAGLAGMVGIPASKVPAFSKITNSQVLTKTTTQFAEAVVGQNNQNAHAALETIQHMVPNIANTNLANDINAATLTATANYVAQRSKFAGAWQQQYGGVGYNPSTGSWNSNWQSKAPYMAFLLNELPPQAVQEIFAQAATNKTLAYQIKQAQAAKPWLEKYGYLGGQ